MEKGRSLDVAVPFDPGLDQEIQQPRYLLMATVTVPWQPDQKLPHEVKMGRKVNKKKAKKDTKKKVYSLVGKKIEMF